MKNYLDITQIPSLPDLKDALLQAAMPDLQEYFEKMPVQQKIKHIKMKRTDFIKMYALPIKYGPGQCPCIGPQIELFNLSADTPEQNYNQGTGPMAQQIENIVGELYDHRDLPCFRNVLNLIPKQLLVAWYFFYKHGAIVDDLGHDHTTIMVHLLLEDIQDGDFIMQVNGEQRIFNKRGEYFIFDGTLSHHCRVTGKEAKFLSFAMNAEDLVA